jgi:hypothetical protein
MMDLFVRILIGWSCLMWLVLGADELARVIEGLN